MSILLQLPNGFSSKVCICACRALGILEREVGAHDRRVGEATCALARIKAAKGQVSAAVNLYQKGLQIMEDCNDVGEDYTTVEIVRSDFATLLDELERCDPMQNCMHTKKVPVPHWIYICFHGCIASYIILVQTITDIRLLWISGMRRLRSYGLQIYK